MNGKQKINNEKKIRAMLVKKLNRKQKEFKQKIYIYIYTYILYKLKNHMCI